MSRRGPGPRLPFGSWLALVGAVGLWVTLFIDWFSFDNHTGWVVFVPNEEQDYSGWAVLGRLADVLLCVAVVSGLVLAAAALVPGPRRRRVAAARIAIGAGTIGFVTLPVAVLLSRGEDYLRWPALAGLLFAALIPMGGWLAQGHARHDALS